MEARGNPVDQMSITLATVIKARRLVRGMEQTALATAIGCDARSVARWESGELPGARHMTGLRAALDLTIDDMDVLVLGQLAGDDARYRIEGTSVLDRLDWDHGELLSRILDLEVRATGIEGQRHCGTVAELSRIFEALPDSWRVLTSGGQVVGVWHILPLSPGAFEDLRAGRIGEGEVTLSDVETLDVAGVIDVSLSSVAIERSVRSARTFALVIGSLAEVTTDLIRRGVSLRRVCVQAWSPQTLLLCRRLGFRQVGTLSGVPTTVPILEAEVGALLAHPALARLVPRHPAIALERPA